MIRKLLFLSLILLNLSAIAQVPVITSFSPASGTVGTVVTIVGENFFIGNTAVFFGGVQGSIESSSTTTIKVKVPAGSQYSPITIINLSNGLQVRSALPFLTTFNEGDVKSFTTKSFEISNIYSSYGGVEIGADIKIADLDGDGKLDIAVLNTNETINIFRNTSVKGILNKNSLSLSATLYIYPKLPSNSPYAIKIADLDGDGKSDIVLAYRSTNKVAIFKNNCNPGNIDNLSFGEEIRLNTGSSPASVDVTDIDGDGKPEIITANESSGKSISIFKNVSNKGSLNANSFSQVQNFNAGSGSRSLSIADLNSDGKLDIVLGGDYNSFYTLTNTSTSSKLSFDINQIYAPIPNYENINNNQLIVCVADLDADNKLDIIVNPNVGDNVYIFKNNTLVIGGKIILAEMVTIPTKITRRWYGTPSSIFIADINGDTKPDILLEPNFYVLSNNIKNNIIDANSFKNQVELDKNFLNASIITAADIDGDGKTEIIGAGKDLIIFHNKINGNPKIISFTPKSAKTGETVTITGKNFTGTNNVSFGGVNATTFEVKSSTIITAVVAKSASGNILVSNVDGIDTLADFAYIGPPPPKITSFTPNTASVDEKVIITGTNFTEVSEVKFGDISAKSFIVNSNTQITAILDTGATGNVSVETPYGISSLPGFTFLPLPTIVNLANSNVAKGDTVIINGTNFTGTTAIVFGGVPAVSFIVISPTKIKAVIGDGENGELTVTTPFGTAKHFGIYYVIPAPIITNFIPKAANAGDTVIINGNYFSILPQKNFVFFGAVKAVVTQASITQLKVIVPTGATYQPINVVTHGKTSFSS